ncbi:hypothetical protein H072_3578 [Dactylellina haptotyla CBS 200.50]|uniref:GDP/GTP exchange factor Sec2 N-terminal domain-containing protein n=1 Tax=Dactylellina haptotyla (strain CBS 200.50) TaxID=1284197 RepID=S8AH81_DACHA|nr:hypothetical protein H072_3578 [Dactylellina haptotyla CBS 200.50]
MIAVKPAFLPSSGTAIPISALLQRRSGSPARSIASNSTARSYSPPAHRPKMPSTSSSASSIAESIPTSDFCICKNCGIAITFDSEDEFPREARLRIEELEQQVKEFSVRAVMAAERLAQAQKEIIDLRRKSESALSAVNAASAATAPVNLTPEQTPKSPSTSSTYSAAAFNRTNVTATLQSTYKASTQRLNQLFAYRTGPQNGTLPSTTGMPPPVERPPTPPEPLSRASLDSQQLDDLSNALCEERRGREMAEKQLASVKSELEDLSVNLFQQANEMVSAERKARARLEERVHVLERRDQEKRVRLERLEQGLERIGRVRGMLNTATMSSSTTPIKAA